jgi:hypothetical protein
MPSERTRRVNKSALMTQHSNRVSTNASLRRRETQFSRAETKTSETAPAIQWADCRDKMRARIAASSGLFALNREISVCAGLRGGAGRTRTSNQTVIAETRLNQGSPHRFTGGVVAAAAPDARSGFQLTAPECSMLRVAGFGGSSPPSHCANRDFSS